MHRVFPEEKDIPQNRDVFVMVIIRIGILMKAKII
jgi:hypothetical protein